MAASDPTMGVATPTGTLQGAAAFSWDGSSWQSANRAGPGVPTPTGVLRGVALFTWNGSAWQPAGRAQSSISTPSGVLEGVAVYTWSGTAWTPAGGTPTPSTPTGSLRGIAAFTWDGAAWQPAAQARPSVPTPYGVLDGVALFNWTGGSAWVAAPPAASQGPPDTNTVLLMHSDGTAGSTTFTDSSAYAHTLTPTGVTVNATSKFGSGAANFTASRSPYIDTGNAADFNFGSSPFTMEAWCYFTSQPGGTPGTIFGQMGVSGNQGFFFYADNVFVNLQYAATGSGLTTVFGAHGGITLNTWMHIAVDRDVAGILRLYANGVVLGTPGSVPTIYPSTANGVIGNGFVGGGSAFTGYLDEVRISKGVARYGGAFTPPTGPFPDPPPLPQTVLLMHADGTAGSTTFTDSSSYAHTLTASNGAQISTANPKFGSGAIDTSTNTAAVIDTGNISHFAFGNQPFTVEAWSYFQSDTNALHIIACQWSPAGATNFSWLFGMTDNATLGFYYTTNNSDYTLVSGAFTPTLNTWYHLACDRDASDMLRVYVNGAVIGSGSVAGKTFFAPTTNCAIGNELSGTYDVQGFLDEVRISNVARYGGAFTPPTAPFSA